ncbi:hypothetical protein ACX9R5_03980 [Rathayibacter sp. CAU 1779]
MTDPLLSSGPVAGVGAPDFTGSEPVFASRKERRAYEDALAQASETSPDANPPATSGIAPGSATAPATSPAAWASAPAYGTEYPTAAPAAGPFGHSPASPSAPYASSSPAAVSAPAPTPYTPARASAPSSPASAPAPYTPADASPPYIPAAAPQARTVATPHAPAQTADPFTQLLGLAAEPARETQQRGAVDVRGTDVRLDDPRRSPDAGRAHRVDEVPVTTHTGRVRLRPEELARSTDSAPVPLALPGAPSAQPVQQRRTGARPGSFDADSFASDSFASDSVASDPFVSDDVGGGIFGSALFGEEELGGAAASVGVTGKVQKAQKAEKRAAAKAAKLAAAEARRANTKRSGATSSTKPGVDDAGSYAEVAGAASAAGQAGRGAARGAASAATQVRPKKARTVRVHGARLRTVTSRSTSGKRRSPLTKFFAKAGIMLAAAGMVATTAVPAYAQFDTPTWIDPSTGRTQTLAVGAIQDGALAKDDFGAHTLPATLDSTTGTVVAPEVQALAQQLMTAVTQGRLTGSTPDHIFEIRYLAAGEAVQGCGIDYRVLQTIAVALNTFNTVGVSDINRHCTGQIEGAGTASAHYTDGGGHAVDFFRLNGHALTGGDSDSIKLLETLDRVVPSDSTVGQVGCRSSLSLSHFQQIDDTCNHLHIDFLDASGTSLLG